MRPPEKLPITLPIGRDKPAKDTKPPITVATPIIIRSHAKRFKETFNAVNISQPIPKPSRNPPKPRRLELFCIHENVVKLR